MNVSRYTNTVENVREAIRSFRSVCLFIIDTMIETSARLMRNRNYVREKHVGDGPNEFSNSTAVYVHFDMEGIVFDYVIYQLKQLVNAGFRITFVSNSPKFPEESRRRLTPYCCTIIWRFNNGYDFGAYKDGIAAIPNINDVDQLILMNDSIYGPFEELRETLAQIDRSNTDYWGIVSSWEGHYHLQTFFLVFFPVALQSSVFQGFWRNLPYVNNKRWVIRNCEMRLNYLLARGGLRSRPLIDYWSVAQAVRDSLSERKLSAASDHEREYYHRLSLALLRGRPVNPMHFFWNILVTDYRCPFLKRELIQVNPAKIPLVESWAEVIQSASNYDTRLISDHQKQLRDRRAKVQSGNEGNSG